MKNMKNIEIKLFAASLCISLIFTSLVAIYASVEELSAQERIAEEIIRFHILPNSNTEADQELKMLVQQEVLHQVEQLTSRGKNIKETREIITANLNNIEETARQIIVAAGENYHIHARLDNIFFPRVVYEDMVLPRGYYEALQITIGQGQGQNWWCVMFPMMCFVEGAKGGSTEEMRQLMEGVLTAEEKGAMFNVRFRSVEWFREQ